MNWKEIVEKYPKSHKMAMDYISGKTKDIFWYPNNRWLLDFFDGNDIIISIQGFINDENIKIFDYCIQERNTLNGMAGDWFNDRSKCEAKAFIKAFEILENKLS